MADLVELFFDQKFTAQPVICKYIQFRYLKGEKVIDFSELFLLVYKSWSALWLAHSLNHLLRKLFFPILSCIQFINSTEKSNGRVKKLKCEIRLLYSNLNFLFMRLLKG